jgi:hypothetical protein
MRLLGTAGVGFAIAFGVGWIAKFSYQTDWIAGLILFATLYLSLQIDELYTLVIQSVPGALEHAKLPGWVKTRIGDERTGA